MPKRGEVMAGFRRPVIDGSQAVNIQDGTLCRAESPKPGAVGAGASYTVWEPPSPADHVAAAFQRCQQLGWIPFFQEAAQANSFEPELLMGIGYRESNLNPKYLKVPGDNGHGYGLMQIDIRSYPAWVKAGDWKDPKSCISKGAEVLASKRDEIVSSVGKKNIKVRTLAGKTYGFDGKEIVGQALLRVTVAAYNCGLWAYYHYSKGHDVDQGTTGRDYSKDVLKKTARFKQLLDTPQDSRGWLDLPQSLRHFA
jgi:hypothetical protein